MAKKRVVIFGTGNTGERIYNSIKESDDTLFFVDNNKDKWNKKYCGKDILAPEVLKNTDGYDMVYVASMLGIDAIPNQLVEMGVPYDKIDKTYVTITLKAREMFVKRFSQMIYVNNTQGAVAEAGVYRGDFSKEINKYFYDRKLYLFDTFEGFVLDDLTNQEKESIEKNIGYLSNTSEQVVLEKLPFKENADIRKGYFPDTAKGIEEKFVFVNLDLDIYKPTLEGLRFFWPRMQEGCVILVHDYFNEIFPNIKKCIDDFEKEIGKGIHKVPVGDDFSIALIK